MKNDTPDLELLIRYVDRELTPEEAGRVEAAILENPAMSEALENIRATRQSLKSYALRQQVSEIRKEMLAGQQAPVRRLPFQRVWLRRTMAAAAVFLLLLSAICLYEYAQLTPGRLYTANFQAYSPTVSRETEVAPLAAAFREGNYGLVIRLFASLSKPGVNDLFLAGNAYLALRQPTEAIRRFDSLQQLNLANGTHNLEDDTEYFLAMSYLAAGLPAQATPLFDKIHRQSGHLYHDKVGDWFVWKLHHLH